MDRMNELWRETGGPGTAPAVSPRSIKNRVNAALDADPKDLLTVAASLGRLASAAVRAL